MNCCSNLFSKFEFQDLRAELPNNEKNKKGVYVIRVKRRDKPVKEIVEQIKQFVRKINWKSAEDFILSRIKRLEMINQCPIIYIGSAGERAKGKPSKVTLNKRRKQLSKRHTASYPIFALIYLGWELEFLWKEEVSPRDTEEQLKREYKEAHNGKLPALVEQ